MIRRLRRAHLVTWSMLGLGLPAALGFAFRHRHLGPQLGQRAQVADSAGGRVVAVAAWPVGRRDTLYFHLEATGDPANPWTARFSASANARWPDAAVYWSPEPAPEAPLTAQAVSLGLVAAGADLRASLPGRGGTFHLQSGAWARRLGSWPAPVSAPENRP